MWEAWEWQDSFVVGWVQKIVFYTRLITFHVPLALLGEVDLLAGQILCPRSPPDSLASFTEVRVSKEDWVVEGICAYVPQVSHPILENF